MVKNFTAIIGEVGSKEKCIWCYSFENYHLGIQSFICPKILIFCQLENLNFFLMFIMWESEWCQIFILAARETTDFTHIFTTQVSKALDGFPFNTLTHRQFVTWSRLNQSPEPSLVKQAHHRQDKQTNSLLLENKWKRKELLIVGDKPAAKSQKKTFHHTRMASWRVMDENWSLK